MFHNNIPRMLIILVISRYYYVLAMFHGITIMTRFGITPYTLSSWHYISTVIPRFTRHCYARLKKYSRKAILIIFLLLNLFNGDYYGSALSTDWLIMLFIRKRQNNAINSKQNQSRSPPSNCLRKRLNCDFRPHSPRRYSSNDTHILNYGLVFLAESKRVGVKNVLCVTAFESLVHFNIMDRYEHYCYSE